MKSYLTYLRRANIQMPIWFGKMLGHVPFGIRPGIGRDYKLRFRDIRAFDKLPESQKKDYIFKKFFEIFRHSRNNIPFYQELYDKHNFRISDLKTFEDIENVPIIRKRDLINAPIEHRSYIVKGRFKVNTGGSTGEPLYFYMDPKRFSNEWAHIHYFWNILGYEPSSIKLVFDGRSDVSEYIQYDFLRNSLRYNIYSEHDENIKRLKRLVKSHRISFLHGYPSAIYDFANYCENNDPDFVRDLSQSLEGVFLTSEYPSPIYRKKIEDLFGVRTQSFYGHTESCVMAYEDKQFEYNVLQTYGFAECHVISGQNHLIGTSYYNYASPLIRYDTEDIIDPITSNGLLERFSIEKGRAGEYILDKNEKKISLTGLIYGRHHELFDRARYIQIEQRVAGEATVYYVPNNLKDNQDMNGLFDSSNVLINFELKRLNSPILTKSGKVNLLIHSA